MQFLVIGRDDNFLRLTDWLVARRRVGQNLGEVDSVRFIQRVGKEDRRLGSGFSILANPSRSFLIGLRCPVSDRNYLAPSRTFPSTSNRDWISMDLRTGEEKKRGRFVSVWKVQICADLFGVIIVLPIRDTIDRFGALSKWKKTKFIVATRQ